MEILENYIKQVAYTYDRPNKQEQSDIVALYNIFKDRIGLGKADIFYYTLWKSGGFNKILLDLFIRKMQLNLSDYLRLVLDKNNNTYERIKYSLEKYAKKYITPLELTELSLIAKNYDEKEEIIDLFYKYGAKKINDTESFWAKQKFVSENKTFFRERSAFWCQKDRVLCRHIFKELKKDYDLKINNVIHVTGSNGKGSTCAFLEYMLRAQGYTVNKFTSPFLIKESNEIILSGKPIDNELYYEAMNKVKLVYEKVIKTEEYKEELNYVLTHNRIFDMQTRTDDPNGVLIWCFIIPVVAYAFAKRKADFNIVEVVTGGLNDFTNIFTPEETIATVITNIKYGIGSNDGCMNIFNEKNEVEESNRSVAYHKSMLGKKGVPMIVANQSSDVLKEIRYVAKEKVETDTFEYGRDWFLRDIDKNSFSIKIFGETLKFKKSKTLFEKFQTTNTATALAVLLKLEKDGKLKLDHNLLQKGIDDTKIAARPQRILNGNYKDFFGKKTEIIYGVVKLNKSGVESIENIIKEYPDYYNYFIYTSGNSKALNSHEMYFFNFMKRQKRSKLIIYRKNEEIYNKIKQHFDDNGIKYIEKNMLSQAMIWVKKNMDSSVKNRIFILCDSMKKFDKNIYFLNETKNI